MKGFIQDIYKFNIIIFFISFCSSIVFVQLLGVKLSVFIFTFIIILILVLNNKRRDTIKILVLSLALFLGVLRIQYDIYILSSRSHIKRYIGQEVEIDGLLIRELDKNTYVTKAVVEIVRLTVSGNTSPPGRPHGNVILEYDSYIRLRPFDNITFKGVLKEIVNNSDFDYKAYLEDSNIYSIVSSREVYANIHKREYSIMSRISNAKYKINKKMFSTLPSPHSELLMGILYGSGIEISDDLGKKMSNVGITHIVAVSGYNISLLLISTEKFAKLLGRKLYTYSAIFLIIIFMIFVGLNNIPVVRAGFMCITFLICQITGRKRYILLILSLSVFIFMVINPNIYKFVSFQLTFASTSGILIMSKFYKRVFGFLPNILLEDFASTISAISFTLPVIIFNFGKISIISPVVNLFVLPVVSVITVGGLVIVFLAIFNFQIFVFILSAFFWLMIEYVIWIVNIFSIDGVMVVVLDSRISRNMVGVAVCLTNLVLIDINRRYHVKSNFYKDK